MVSKNLVQECLYNWLGYGELNSPTWIIGTEEGGSGEKIQLESALKLRSSFNLSMDFRYVWENLYGVDLQNVKGPTIWRYAACFLLSLQNKNRSPEDIKKFVFIDKRLGRKNADHFICEFLPLPKKNKNSIEDYVHIWPTTEEYHREVALKRFSIIDKNIRNNEKIKLMVSYESMFTRSMTDYYKNYIVGEPKKWSCKKQHYCLYEIKLSQDRNIFLLSTPFFGLGQISYAGLDFASQKIKKSLKI